MVSFFRNHKYNTLFLRFRLQQEIKMSKLNRLQKKIADLRERLSSLGKDDPEIILLQREIDFLLIDCEGERCKTMKKYLREEIKRYFREEIYCASGSKDCESSSIVDPAKNRRCHCGCNKLFDRVTHCNVEKIRSGYGPKHPCRNHISFECRARNRQCEDCVSRCWASESRKREREEKEVDSFVGDAEEEDEGDEEKGETGK